MQTNSKCCCESMEHYSSKPRQIVSIKWLSILLLSFGSLYLLCSDFFTR